MFLSVSLPLPLFTGYFIRVEGKCHTIVQKKLSQLELVSDRQWEGGPVKVPQYKIEFTFNHCVSDIFSHQCGLNIHPLRHGLQLFLGLSLNPLVKSISLNVNAH